MYMNKDNEIEYFLLPEADDEICKERYALAIERIKQIKEEKEVASSYADYFERTASFILLIDNVFELVQNNRFEGLGLKEHEELNYRMYEDILPDQYETSYANPAYAAKYLGLELGRMLSYVYTELRGGIYYAIEGRFYEWLIHVELYLEIYHEFLTYGDNDVVETIEANVRNAIRSFNEDYCDVLVDVRSRETFGLTRPFFNHIIETADLTTPDYLYLSGEYVGENERKIHEFLNGCSEEQIEAMARTYTEGYRIGFINNNLDLSIKEYVNIRYNLGFERMVKVAMRQFEEMGLKTVIYRAAASSMNKKMNRRIGFQSISPNHQFEYDHRMDEGIFYDKAYVARKLQVLKNSYERYKEEAGVFAGPAVIEIFGETPFYPVNKPECVSLDEKQRALMTEFTRESGILLNKAVKKESISFTIIAYPIPEIGERFDEIFAETVKVNTLDMNQYRDIQERMIDALNQGECVQIKGKDGNKTDLIIALWPIDNPDTQTKFENCLADVNIPVGEVFTSPKLIGTNGIFHVSEVFLNELQYKNIQLVIKDGMIEDYTCSNFEEEEKNKDFIKENLLYQQKTLPMGEFAIGTNTTAYKLGKNFGISHLLPILIAEKTGPHFAFGDTCFAYAEEMKSYNPDGKEMICKENECSKLRHTDISKAYFSCHTDITIPYDELGEITVITASGIKIPIIYNGRFVLPGTEALNEPLDEIIDRE